MWKSDAYASLFVFFGVFFSSFVPGFPGRRDDGPSVLAAHEDCGGCKLVLGQASSWRRVDKHIASSLVASETTITTTLGFVIVGILLFLTFIGFSLLFLELWLIMMVVLVLLLIL